MTENITSVEYVDWDASDDMFGKVVARSDVRNMTPAQIETEIAEMREILGHHVTARKVETVPAVSTPVNVKVYDGIREGMDTDGGRWQVVCETHGTILSARTRKEAEAEARHARANFCCDWCEECCA